MALTKEFLGSSTYGRGIKVAATATPGTQIHQAHATAKDEIWLWAYNSDSAARDLTIEFGGTTSPDDLVKVSIPPNQGWFIVVEGQPLSNSLVVRAFASAANVLTIRGYVNRIPGA